MFRRLKDNSHWRYIGATEGTVMGFALVQRVYIILHIVSQANLIVKKLRVLKYYIVGGGLLPHIKYIGMCRPKRYGF